jgi:UDP-N-acetylglucosamine--N-acetylmuramyl-(pentapeptide) pyrophosphoryl-undecaprenol N-acetylglucosamine transferase
VSHQAREEDLATVQQRYSDAGIVADVEPFFNDVPARLAEAQLVISRAGASSVADISVIGRPAIFIPLKIATHDHQTANARGLVEAGGAQIIAEDDLTALELARQVFAILSTPAKANSMAAASKAYGKPEATESLVLLVEELAFQETGAA